MTNENIRKLQLLVEQGCTDSDIENFCEENGADMGEAFQLVAEWAVPDCCQGCNYIQLWPAMSPCCNCCRAKPDHYTARKE